MRDEPPLTERVPLAHVDVLKMVVEGCRLRFDSRHNLNLLKFYALSGFRRLELGENNFQALRGVLEGCGFWGAFGFQSADEALQLVKVAAQRGNVTGASGRRTDGGVLKGQWLLFALANGNGKRRIRSTVVFDGTVFEDGLKGHLEAPVRWIVPAALGGHADAVVEILGEYLAGSGLISGSEGTDGLGHAEQIEDEVAVVYMEIQGRPAGAFGVKDPLIHAVRRQRGAPLKRQAQEFAGFVRLHEFFESHVFRPEADALADLGANPCLGRGIGDFLPVTLSQSQGLFAKEMFLGLDCDQCVFHMQIGRQADVHHVRLDFRQGGFKRIVERRVNAEFLHRSLCFVTGRVDDRDDAGLFELLIDLGVHGAHESETGEYYFLHKVDE